MILILRKLKCYLKQIERYLSQRPSLGMILHSKQVEANTEISLSDEAIYCVRQKDDYATEIRGVCVHSGLLFMTDYNNNTIKRLLDTDCSYIMNGQSNQKSPSMANHKQAFYVTSCRRPFKNIVTKLSHFSKQWTNYYT